MMGYQPQRVMGQWRQPSASNAWNGGDGVGLVSYRGDIYKLGGWNPDAYNPSTHNEFWKSTNRGQDWTQLSTPPWEGRHTFGHLVHRDRIMVIGGDANRGRYQKDVWSWSPEEGWVRRTSSASWASPGRVLFNYWEFNDALYVGGGQTLDELAVDAPANLANPYYEDMWRSTDLGASWTQIATGLGHFGMMIGNAVKDGKMWIIGSGRYGTGQFSRAYSTAVRNSSDGITWSTVTSDGGFGQRQYHNIAVLGADFVMHGGYNGADMRDVRASSDGINWRNLGTPPWEACHAASLVAHKGELLKLGGPMTSSAVWGLS